MVRFLPPCWNAIVKQKAPGENATQLWGWMIENRKKGAFDKACAKGDEAKIAEEIGKALEEYRKHTKAQGEKTERTTEANRKGTDEFGGKGGKKGKGKGNHFPHEHAKGSGKATGKGKSTIQFRDWCIPYLDAFKLSNGQNAPKIERTEIDKDTTGVCFGEPGEHMDDIYDMLNEKAKTVTRIGIRRPWNHERDGRSVRSIKNFFTVQDPNTDVIRTRIAHKGPGMRIYQRRKDRHQVQDPHCISNYARRTVHNALVPSNPRRSKQRRQGM